jgi:biotin carboxylase
MIVVLSLYRPRVEDFLAARGEDILAVIPESMRTPRESTNPGYPIRTIDQWDNYNALTRLAVEFEGLEVTAVTTIDEPCIRAAAFLRDLLGLPGQDHNSAVGCTDKSVMKRRLEAAGIPVAEHRIVHSQQQIRAFLDEMDGDDIVVKPRHGFGTINTHRVSQDNFDQLAADGAFAGPSNLPDYFDSTSVAGDILALGYVAERYIDVAAEYYCELFLDEGSLVHCLAGRYSNPILSDHLAGSVWLRPNSPEAIEVCELTLAAASALGLTHGFGHCEIFRDRSGRWLVGELASRPGGLEVPRMLQLSYGIDNLALLADQLAGRRPSTELAPQANGAIAFRPVPAPAGVITNIPDEAQLLALPGVIEAEIFLKAGDSTGDLLGAMTHAAHIFCGGDTTEEAEKFADSALSYCRITVDAGS